MWSMYDVSFILWIDIWSSKLHQNPYKYHFIIMWPIGWLNYEERLLSNMVLIMETQRILYAYQLT